MFVLECSYIGLQIPQTSESDFSATGLFEWKIYLLVDKYYNIYSHGEIHSHAHSYTHTFLRKYLIERFIYWRRQ